MSPSRTHTTVTTDDGTILEVKEAEVLGRDGAILSSPESPHSHSGQRTYSFGGNGFQVKTFRGGWVFSLLLLIAIPLLLFAGLSVIGVILVGMIAVGTLRALLRVFR